MSGAAAVALPLPEPRESLGLRCPYCKDLGPKLTVASYQLVGGSRVRRRACGGCGRRFTTREQIERPGGGDGWEGYG